MYPIVYVLCYSEIVSLSSLKAMVPLLVLVLFFILSTYSAERYHDALTALISGVGDFGILSYVALSAIATVVAPLSSVPLIPIASQMWGPIPTALASIVGWFVGAVICFALSRAFGMPFVKKAVSPERLLTIEKKLIGKNLFWTIVLLRMIIPVDILSYVLGLFPIVSWRVYLGATAIGIVPFAFVFAYLGSIPVQYQILAFVILSPVIYVVSRS